MSGDSSAVVNVGTMTLPGPLALRHGGELRDYTLAYETYGELSEAKDNVILLFHALTGSQHAAGYRESVPGVGDLWTEECQTGWWDGFVGPGRALNTDRFHVICVNYVGGCYGSTGPASINVETGKPWGSAFPRVSVSDIVDSQVALLDALGIEKLHAAVGSSVGGMLCVSLATRYPERVGQVIPVASGITTSPLQRILNFEQIMAIESDRFFERGDYYEGEHPDAGLALARMIGHKTFISLSTLENRANAEIRQPDGELSWYRLQRTLESYMHYQGQKFVKRFDANTYLRIMDAWQDYDPVADAGCGSVERLFEGCRGQRYLIFSIDSDVCFYPGQQAEMVQLLTAAGVPNIYLTVHSEKGHDSFLLEPELFTPHLVYALEGR